MLIRVHGAGVRYVDTQMILMAYESTKGGFFAKLKGGDDVRLLDAQAWRDATDPVIGVAPAEPGTFAALAVYENVHGPYLEMERVPVLAWRVRRESVEPVFADWQIAEITNERATIGSFAFCYPSGRCEFPGGASFDSLDALEAEWRRRPPHEQSTAS
jgi:hypothetical protein